MCIKVLSTRDSVKVVRNGGNAENELTCVKESVKECRRFVGDYAMR